MSYCFRNFVFEGGGVKGIAYLGALEVLEEKGVMSGIHRVGGTSAGAIIAVLIGLGYTCKELGPILREMDFNQFTDKSSGLIRNTCRLLGRYGWCKGDYFRRWIAELIEKKTGNGEATFAEVEKKKEKNGFKSIYLMGTNLCTSFCEVFSAENPDTCDLPIADAVRISMSIPFFFTAPRCGQKKDVYTDGGVLDNYPVKLFDRKAYLDSENYRETEYYTHMNDTRAELGLPAIHYVYNKETLGFRLDTKEEIDRFKTGGMECQRKSINGFYGYAEAVIQALLEVQQSVHLHSDDWQRTLYIDTKDVGTTDFGLTGEKKDELIASGEQGAREYFAWLEREPNRHNHVAVGCVV